MSSKIAYFDCTFGAAGDMLVGACIDCGVSEKFIEEQLRKLKLPSKSFALTAGRVHRANIAATKFDVWLDNQTTENKPADAIQSQETVQRYGQSDMENDELKHLHLEQEHEHEHEHRLGREHQQHHLGTHGHEHYEHSHSHFEDQHSQGHQHNHYHGDNLHSDDHNHDHHHLHHHGAEHYEERALANILRLINESELDDQVKALACRIFDNLGRAESAIHGVPVEEITFHEVGSIDAICDIVGFAIAYSALGITRSFVSPLPLGSGTVKTMHGLFPVPAPAVLSLVQSAAAKTSNLILPYECLTPTGAAILCTIAEGFGAPPAFDQISKVGYGAGTLNPGSHPNVTRVIVGLAAEKSSVVQSTECESTGQCQADIVAVIEANIDDLSPPVMAHAMERLLQEGALDVSLTPILMKKGRLAQQLTVIARPADRDRLSQLMLRETSTIGVRSHFCERLTLSRDFREVSLGDGQGLKIRIKVAHDASGRLVNLQPEYEDCLGFANATGVPLKQVLLQALAEAGNLWERAKISEDDAK